MRTEIDENGNITVNLIGILERMSDTSKQQVIEHFAWHSPIWNELVRGVRNEYAAENFNAGIYEMRLAFFQGDNVPEALRETVKSLLNAIKHLNERERAYTAALAKWRLWWDRNMPAHRQPVPFPDWETDWAGDGDVLAFLKRNGLAGMFEVGDGESNDGSLAFEDGVPCDHPGCASHIKHPCEMCGRTGARGKITLSSGRVWHQFPEVEDADTN